MAGSREPLQALAQGSHIMKAGFQGDQGTLKDRQLLEG